MAVGRRALDVILLIVSVIVWAGAVYLLRGPLVRTAASLLLLWPITLSYNRLSGIEIPLPKERWVKSKRFHKRRFLRLRERVDRLLDEVRLLNRLAVDAGRGFRSREAAEQRMQAIEKRMAELLGEIRASAGLEDEVAEAAEVPASGEDGE